MNYFCFCFWKINFNHVVSLWPPVHHKASYEVTVEDTGCENCTLSDSQHVWQLIQSTWRWHELCLHFISRATLSEHSDESVTGSSHLFVSVHEPPLRPPLIVIKTRNTQRRKHELHIASQCRPPFKYPSATFPFKAGTAGPPWPICVKDKYNPPATEAATSRAVCFC